MYCVLGVVFPLMDETLPGGRPQWMQTPSPWTQTPRGQKKWHTPVKTLPCPKFCLQAVTNITSLLIIRGTPALFRFRSVDRKFRFSFTIAIEFSLNEVF